MGKIQKANFTDGFFRGLWLLETNASFQRRRLSLNRIKFTMVLVSQAIYLFSCQRNSDRRITPDARFTVPNRSAKNIALVVGVSNDLPSVIRDVQNVSKMARES